MHDNIFLVFILFLLFILLCTTFGIVQISKQETALKLKALDILESSIQKDGNNISDENIELLKKIAKGEKG